MGSMKKEFCSHDSCSLRLSHWASYLQEMMTTKITPQSANCSTSPWPISLPESLPVSHSRILHETVSFSPIPATQLHDIISILSNYPSTLPLHSDFRVFLSPQMSHLLFYCYKDTMTKAVLKESINLGLAYSFRWWIYYHHVREHCGMQEDMVLEQ